MTPTRRAALATLFGTVVSSAEAQSRKAPVRSEMLASRPWTTLPPTPALPPATRQKVVMLGKARLWFAEFGERTAEAAAITPLSTPSLPQDAQPANASTKEPILFLHGGYGHSAHWGHQIADFARDRRVFAIDTRGHGRSPMPAGEFSFAAFARDVDGLLAHLAVPAVSIVGWSDGAITAMQVAMTKPERVRRMVLFGANATSTGTIPGGSKSPAFTTYTARCRTDYATLSPTPDRWGELTSGLASMWRREPNFSSASLGRINMPTLVLAAEHDEIIRRDHAASIARSIPGAKFVELQGVSHFALMQEPGKFNAALRSFLDRA